MPEQPAMTSPWRRRAIVAGAIAAAILFVVLAVWRLQASTHPPLSTAPLRQLDGQPTTLAALAGKPMVINLWATWCGPCRAEMPMLLKASRTTPGVRFVFVDQGETAATVQAYLRQQAIQPKHVLLDPHNLLARDYRALGYPTTLFVAADGRLRDTQVGALSPSTLAEHLRRIDVRTQGAPPIHSIPLTSEAP